MHVCMKYKLTLIKKENIYIIYTFGHIKHLSPFLADNSQYFAPYISLKPGREYSIIVTPTRTYPRRTDPWVGRHNGGI